MFALGLMVLFFSCRKNEEDNDDSSDVISELNPEYFAGGDGTVFVTDATAFDRLIANGTPGMQVLHDQGRQIFFQEFVEYGTGEFDGLGPLFIQTSCGGCHPGNGRSQPPLTEVDYNSGLLMRFSLAGSGPNGEPNPVPGYGTQLQNRSIDGVAPEAHFLFYYNIFNETYADGSNFPMHDPVFNVIDQYTPMPPNVLFTLRNGSPVYGLGLLEAVSDEEILSRVDETDDNVDYISGRANYVWNVKSQQFEIGKLGWKASNPTIEQQTAGAFHEDMGVTSEGYFETEIGEGQSNSTTGFGPEPDVEESVIDQVSYYLRTLAVPAPRNLDDPQVMHGRQIFYDLNCNGCHTPQLTTGNSAIPQLANQTIYPYTDLLIHDMGEILADGRPDFDASTNEWRTPPLWGLGLTAIVNPNARYLHDGRASSIEEAILWHGGEAHWAKEYFKSLPAEDREALLAFLNAL